MWKTKIVSIVLATALVLTACGSSEKMGGKGDVLLYEGDKAASGSAVGTSEEYETTKVRKETYKEVFSDTADMEYTDSNTAYIDDEDAILDSIKVRKNQQVHKGDVLAVYHVETSKTKLEKQKLLIQQARANYESGLSNLNANVSQAEKELSRLNTQAEKELKRLEIKKMKKEVEAYKKGEQAIKDQEKEYNQLVSRQSKTYLKAEKSGVVTATGKEYEGDEVDSSKKIVEMRSNNKWILSVKDPDSKLRYNMDVSVRLGKSIKNYSQEVKGKVITATDITGVEETDEDGNSIVYIDVSDADKKKYDFEHNNIYIYAVSFAVKDALVVDAQAVNQEAVEYSNRLFVYILEKGSLHKRFVVSNYNNEKEYLIDQGVTEGQTLAIVGQ